MLIHWLEPPFCFWVISTHRLRYREPIISISWLIFQIAFSMLSVSDIQFIMNLARYFSTAVLLDAALCWFQYTHVNYVPVEKIQLWDHLLEKKHHLSWSRWSVVNWLKTCCRKSTDQRIRCMCILVVHVHNYT